MAPVARAQSRREFRPKNSKWLGKKLTAFDELVDGMMRMLKGEADTFKERVNLFFQQRPQQVAQIEKIQAMYKRLAHRYDDARGELHIYKNRVKELNRAKSNAAIVAEDLSDSSVSSDDESLFNDAHEEVYVDSEEQKQSQEKTEPENEYGEVKRKFSLYEDGSVERELLAAKERIKILEEENERLKEEQQNIAQIDTKGRGMPSFETIGGHRENDMKQTIEVNNATLTKSRTYIHKETDTEELKASVQRLSLSKTTLEREISVKEQKIEELNAAAERSTAMFAEEKSRLEAQITSLSKSQILLGTKLDHYEKMKKQMDEEKGRASANQTEEVNNDAKLREELEFKIRTLTAEVKSNNDLIASLSGHLHKLHMENSKLVKENEAAKNTSMEMQVKVDELKAETESQRGTRFGAWLPKWNREN